jgi:hypothetical protein
MHSCQDVVKLWLMLQQCTGTLAVLHIPPLFLRMQEVLHRHPTNARVLLPPHAFPATLQAELENAGYAAPLLPRTYSHVLFLVQLPDTGAWRWSYMHRDRLWRHYCDKPPRFDKSVATVSSTDSSNSSSTCEQGCQTVQHQAVQAVPTYAALD